MYDSERQTRRIVATHFHRFTHETICQNGNTGPKTSPGRSGSAAESDSSHLCLPWIVFKSPKCHINSTIIQNATLSARQLHIEGVQRVEYLPPERGASRLWRSFEHTQKGMPVGRPDALCGRPPCKAAEPSLHTKMSNVYISFEQRALIRLSTLKRLRPQPIQFNLSDMYHEQAFQLPAVEKWH
jgi:hypothetical protein